MFLKVPMNEKYKNFIVEKWTIFLKKKLISKFEAKALARNVQW
jgi:hypothetical protein